MISREIEIELWVLFIVMHTFSLAVLCNAFVHFFSRPACQSNLFQAWETFLQEIEADSQATIDVASSLSRQVSQRLALSTMYV